MPRKSYIDIAKGIAMLLVIMQHTGGGVSAIATLCKVDVPLFFLCSGLLAYKPEIIYGTQLRKITLRILVPFFAACLFASLFYNENPLHIFTSIGKHEYWFLEALYLILIVFYCQHKLFRHSYPLLICSSIGTEVCFLLLSKYGPEFIDNIAGFSYIARYYPCFIAGCVITRNHIDTTSKLLSSILLIVALTAFLIPSSGNINFLLNVFGYLLGAIYIYFLIKKMHAGLPKYISVPLIKIGQYSLDIYVIHFFIVKYYTHISDNPLLTFIAVICLALIISGFCILVSKIISRTTIFGIFLNRK